MNTQPWVRTVSTRRKLTQIKFRVKYAFDMEDVKNTMKSRYCDLR